MTQLTFRDTRDYVAIDVDKGIDHRTGKLVHADAVAPEGYERLAKCKFCKHYQAEDASNGCCTAASPTFAAYGDMIAITCEDFTAVH